MDLKRKTVFVLICLIGSFAYVYINADHGYMMLHRGLSSIRSLSIKTTGILESRYERNESNLTAVVQNTVHSEDYHWSNLNNFVSSIKFNVTLSDGSCHGHRFLVYTCRSVCGGWGDRLKGITTMFLLAQLLNRTFVIDMPKPCNLVNFLQPNVYNWNVCSTVVTNENPVNVFHTSMMSGISLRKIDDLLSKENSRFPVISIQTNVIGIRVIREHTRKMSRNIMPWLNKLTDAEVTGSILGVLFKPTKIMHDTIERFMTNKIGAKKLICAHIRYGKNPTIPNDTGLRFGAPNVSLVMEFLKSYDRPDQTHTIFVATDSEEIRNQSRHYFQNYVSTDRNIVHVDKTKTGTKESCAGFFTAILEQLILSKCDVLVLTRSNFGAMAAYMRGRSDNLFIDLKGRNSILKVNVTDIQRLYNFV